MTLSPEEIVIYEARLLSAENSLHDLMIGGAARVYVDQNGERVEYAVANAERLRAYILSLKIALGKPTGIIGPMEVWVI
jgi:hypothetical protein